MPAETLLLQAGTRGQGLPEEMRGKERLEKEKQVTCVCWEGVGGSGKNT